MGGNALQNTETRRYAAAEYHETTARVLSALKEALPFTRMEAVQAYHNKPDFGDLDIVVENLNAKQRLEPLLENLGVTEVVRNGPVWSLGWGDLQVDLIFQSRVEYDFACRYFAFNDLGNLVGRVAYKLGFKFGHSGLCYVLRDGDYKVAELTLTKDFDKALSFLGYSPERYNQGFAELEDVFEYVMTSAYYDPESFLLENRSHKARIRDAKRPSYNAFLHYASQNRVECSAVLPKEDALLWARNEFPAFAEELAEARARHERKKLAKQKFNGNFVAELTGLAGKELGALMAKLREDRATHNGHLEEWVLASPPELLVRWVRDAHNAQAV